MRVLVTGGAGFIGSHLAESLLHAGHTVSIIDNLHESYSLKEKQANLDAVRSLGDVRVSKIDIREFEALLDEFRAFKPEAVFHLAAMAGVRGSISQAILYERTNVAGTLQVLEACRLSGVERLVFASSSSVYGASQRTPFREDDRELHPLSPYAATKLAAEFLCQTYAHLYGFGVVCLRLFSVFGPRQRPDLAIRLFTERIERGEPVQVFGNGESARDYTYVDDAIKAICATLWLKARFEVINVGNSRPLSVMTLIRTLENVTQKRIGVIHVPPNPADPEVTCACITKAQALLHYQPEIAFEDGVARFYEWFKGQGLPR